MPAAIIAIVTLLARTFVARLLFTAMQAAQKGDGSGTGGDGSFTAMQAAQKKVRNLFAMYCLFTAMQAAQKCDV